MAILLDVYVSQICDQAEGVKSFELRPDSGVLPEFSAGAHLDIELPGGLYRSYSILNDPVERDRYIIAVRLSMTSRGGSVYLHEKIQVGSPLVVSQPRNNFPLFEQAPDTLLIAGGIGITPMLSMIYRLEAIGANWKLHYVSRTPDTAAFLSILQSHEKNRPGRVHLYFDQQADGGTLNLKELITREPEKTHIYCCGPSGMLAAFEAATQERKPGTVHLEYFSPLGAAGCVSDTRRSYTVVLARSKREIQMSEGKTILDALLDDGIEVPCSCLEGTCGSCEARVLEGIPDHRDVVLTKEEKATNTRMILCCSGSLSDRLVLDL